MTGVTGRIGPLSISTTFCVAAVRARAVTVVLIRHARQLVTGGTVAGYGNSSRGPVRRCLTTMAGDVVTGLVNIVIVCNTTGLGLIEQQEINFSRVIRSRLIHAVIMAQAARAAALMTCATVRRGWSEVDMAHMSSFQVGLVVSLWKLAVRRVVMAGGAVGDLQRIASGVAILAGGLNAAAGHRLGIAGGGETIRVVGNRRSHMAGR